MDMNHMIGVKKINRARHTDRASFVLKAAVRFFSNYEKFIVVIAFLLWLLIVVSFFLWNNCYRKVSVQDLHDSSSLFFSLDAVSAEDAQISGWCIKLGEDIQTYDIRIILWSDKLGYGYTVPAQLQKRKDVTEFIDDGYNYEKSGFSCHINHPFIKDEVYKICIWYRCNGHNEVAETDSYYIPNYGVLYEKPELAESGTVCIDDISVADAQIQGWCIKKGCSIRNPDMDVILWNETEGYGYQFSTYMELRKDITAYMDDGADYDRSGFFCVFDRRWMEDGSYRIYVRYQCDGVNQTIDSGQYYVYQSEKKTIHKKPHTAGNLAFKIDRVSAEDQVISGWCLEKGKSIETYDTRLILWKEDRGYGYMLPAYMVSRKDITQLYGDRYNYDMCGFVCDFKDLLLTDGTYHIYIQSTFNGRKNTVDAQTDLEIRKEEARGAGMNMKEEEIEDTKIESNVGEAET